MFISNSDLELLKENINLKQSNIERIILHKENSKNIQLMCIAFKSGNRYPPIADMEKGNITFIVLEGKLLINTYAIENNEKISSQVVLPKEIYQIPRNIFRETLSIASENTIFVEIIEGSYDPKNRISMDNL